MSSSDGGLTGVGADFAGTAVKVALRVRPLMAFEMANNNTSVVDYPDKKQLSIGANAAKKRAFTFDHVYNENSTQEEVYNTSCKSLVDSYLEGYNATILAYGQTGSGKTHSMGTAATATTNANGDSELVLCAPSDGIIPRVMRQIFETIRSRQLTHEYTIQVSYVELHNEDLICLLTPLDARRADLTIRESNGDVQVMGAARVTVESFEQMGACLERGSLNRTVASTNMNATSSRSHAIFTVYLAQKKLSARGRRLRACSVAAGMASATAAADAAAAAAANSANPGDENGSPSAVTSPTAASANAAAAAAASGEAEDVTEEVLVSKFNFVDLAGSERLKRTGAQVR